MMLKKILRAMPEKRDGPAGQQNVDNVPEASLLVYGPCSNAGDVLIHKTIESLFDGEIKFKYHHIRLDKLEDTLDNIIVGPGGILSGSYTPDKKPDEWLIRHLTRERVQDWKKQDKNLAFSGTGTNSPFDAKKARSLSLQSVNR